MTQLHERVPTGAGALCSCGAIWPCPNGPTSVEARAGVLAPVAIDALRTAIADQSEVDAVATLADTLRAIVDEGPLAGRLRVLVIDTSDPQQVVTYTGTEENGELPIGETIVGVGDYADEGEPDAWVHIGGNWTGRHGGLAPVVELVELALGSLPYPPTISSEIRGEDRIAAERYRQRTATGPLREGYSDEHDDEHEGGDLLRAALTYATLALAQVDRVNGWDAPTLARIIFEDLWPWDEGECNLDDDPVRNLVRAGALIAAELDRLYRRDADELAELRRHVPSVEQILAVDADEIPGGDL